MECQGIYRTGAVVHIKECWVINRTGTGVDVVFVGYRTVKEADAVWMECQG